MQKTTTKTLAGKGILFASIILLSFLINSCSSEKRFGFREKVKVDYSRNEIKKNKKANEKPDDLITVSNEQQNIPLETKSGFTNPQKVETSTVSQSAKRKEIILKEKQITSTKLISSNVKLIPQKEFKSNDDGEKKTSGLALTGFILALAGLFLAAVILGPLAIVFSAIGLAMILGSGKYKGLGFAITGLVLGVIDTVIGLLVIAALSK
jgi:hypothetical protein